MIRLSKVQTWYSRIYYGECISDIWMHYYNACAIYVSETCIILVTTMCSVDNVCTIKRLIINIINNIVT